MERREGRHSHSTASDSTSIGAGNTTSDERTSSEADPESGSVDVHAAHSLLIRVCIPSVPSAVVVSSPHPSHSSSSSSSSSCGSESDPEGSRYRVDPVGSCTRRQRNRKGRCAGMESTHIAAESRRHEHMRRSRMMRMGMEMEVVATGGRLEEWAGASAVV